MAITTDTGAKKIAGTDNWRDIFDDHNDTIDAYDANIASLADGMAIMANGNTHAAIASGQAVYVRNHSTLAAGLYWANTAIATNGTLSTSNLTADASGGLNKLKGDIDSLNSNFNSLIKVRKKAATVTTDGTGMFKPDEATGDTIAVLLGVTATSNNWYHFRIYSGAGGAIRVIVTNFNNDTVLANTTLNVTLAYIV